jgi:hypothetical protein
VLSFANLTNHIISTGGTFAVIKYLTAAKLAQSNSTNGQSNSEEKNCRAKKKWWKQDDFYASLIAGAAGTIVSSPFNYVRNIKYGWNPSESPPNTIKILQDLYQEAKTSGKFFSALQNRLRIGW